MANTRAMLSAGFFGLLVGGTAAALFYGIAAAAGMIGMYDDVVYGGTAATLIVGLVVGGLFGWSRVPPPPP